MDKNAVWVELLQDWVLEARDLTRMQFSQHGCDRMALQATTCTYQQPCDVACSCQRLPEF